MKGIYKILNLVNKKVYIGKCQNLVVRKRDHLKLLRKNTHFNGHLQAAFNKYGESNFKFELIEQCEDLNTREIFYIGQYKALNKLYGYNLQEGGFGGKHSEETILKQKLIRQSYAKKVFGFDKKGSFKKEWFSIKECAKELNVNSCDVRRTIKQEQYSCKGYILQNVAVFDNRLTPSQKISMRKRNSKGLFIK